ncbi:MAG: phosphate signaling complex PhoU family protein, partial [Planctomycetota bacterium]
MTHYEERLEKDLDAIRSRLTEVARAVRHALKNAIHALLNMDRKMAAETIIGDLKINRAIREIDRLCHAFVARHLPSAGHLRFVSSVLRMDITIERIGDYAATISREALQLSAPPPPAVARDIEMMADQSLRMFAQSMKAFFEQSPELARGTRGMSDALQSTFHKVFTDLLSEADRGSRPVADLFALLLVLNRLERVR